MSSRRPSRLFLDLPTPEADELIEHYHRLIRLTDPEMVPYAAGELLQSSRHLIRKAVDVPVLLSAMASKPDWLLTHNTKRFTQSVAKRSGLRIAPRLNSFGPCHRYSDRCDSATTEIRRF